MRATIRPWSKNEIGRLNALVALDVRLPAIQQILCAEFGHLRTLTAIKSRLGYNQTGHAQHVIDAFRGRKPADEQAMDEMYRRRGLKPASNTAAICGDPLPTCSELDKREKHKCD